MKTLWKPLLCTLFLSCFGLCILSYRVTSYFSSTYYATVEWQDDKPMGTPRARYFKTTFKGKQEIFRTRKLPKVLTNTRKSSIQKKEARDMDYQHKQMERYGKLVPSPNTTVKEKVQEHERYTTSQEKEKMGKPDLCVLSLSYMDQMTWASTRWRSLQCWASQLSQRYNIQIIEPFVTDRTHLGVPTHIKQNLPEVLKFSDIFDTSSWQRSVSNGSFPVNIVSWDAFLSSGARNVVTVQIVYPYHSDCTENRQTDVMCNNKRMHRLFSQHLAVKDFIHMKSICINFRELGILTMGQFNDMIFDSIPEDLPITIMFDEWRGLGEKSCIAHVSGGNCSVYNHSFIDTTLNLMTPSLKVNNAARKYIHQYIHRNIPAPSKAGLWQFPVTSDQNGYVAIMIRWEKILNYDFYSYHKESQHYTGSKCIRRILEYVQTEVHEKRHIRASFLTTDIGKYGSSTFKLYNLTQTNISTLRKYSEKLLRILHYSKSLRLSEYEQRFEKISGTTNPAFISQLQKSIAARARCLLLVGWGNFLTNTLDIYKKLHKGKLCYKRIMLC